MQRLAPALGLSLVACLIVSALACSGDRASTDRAARARSGRLVIRIIGSDTMVNLLQAWAEQYKRVRPEVVVQVAGGGSGVGIAALVDGTLDVAAASREMRDSERARASARYGASPRELTVARDALAVYVHGTNPIDRIALTDLAEIYGEHGELVRWSQMGVDHSTCKTDRIMRVGRQNNSGTFAYFRDVVLGRSREYKMGSIDQSGSKDVVALVSRTPCAIGYSGIAYATPDVRALGIATAPGDTPVAPSEESVLNHLYPLARPLYLYTAGEPDPHVREFLEWVLSPLGQHIVRDVGFVSAADPQNAKPAGGDD